MRDSKSFCGENWKKIEAKVVAVPPTWTQQLLKLTTGSNTNSSILAVSLIFPLTNVKSHMKNGFSPSEKMLAKDDDPDPQGCLCCLHTWYRHFGNLTLKAVLWWKVFFFIWPRIKSLWWNRNYSSVLLVWIIYLFHVDVDQTLVIYPQQEVSFQTSSNSGLFCVEITSTSLLAGAAQLCCLIDATIAQMFGS